MTCRTSASGLVSTLALTIYVQLTASKHCTALLRDQMHDPLHD